MGARRVIVGAVGGDGYAAAARSFGAAVARAGCILLTGGGDQCGNEVKNASICGALSEGRASQHSGVVARFVGILARAPVDWELRPPAGLLLHTRLTHFVRNVINGLTPDVVVVFGGSRGTLAEAAFAAIVAGKPTFFFGEPDNKAAQRPVQQLTSNFHKYFEQADSKDVETYFVEPLQNWPQLASRWSGAALRLALREHLEQASDWTGSDDELIEHCKAAVESNDLLDPTGFPGLPGDDGSKARFEQELERISTVQ